MLPDPPSPKRILSSSRPVWAGSPWTGSSKNGKRPALTEVLGREVTPLSLSKVSQIKPRRPSPFSGLTAAYPFLAPAAPLLREVCSRIPYQGGSDGGKGRQGPRRGQDDGEQGQEKGHLAFFPCWPTVSGGENPQAVKSESCGERQSRSNRCSILSGNPGIPDCRSSRASWKREQRSQS